MLIGYARVSTQDQNLDRQLDSLSKAGVEKIFTEKITGTKKDRPELTKMFEQLRKDDTLIICDLTRLSRSTKDLIELTETLTKKSVELISLKEKIDTTTATGKAMFGMMAVMAQFERDLIRERTVEGLASARARGRKGGRPKINEDKIKIALKMYESKEYSLAEITNTTGISKMTIYRYLKNN